MAAVAIALVVCAIPTVAYAFSDPGFTSEFSCNECHSTTSVSALDWEGKGPHGFYTTTTNKCKVCHSVHQAPTTGWKLLTNATVTGTCLACHDGTGGTAPYDAIQSRGGTVAAEHSMETTSAVPGGSSALDDVLGCQYCHSVHRNNVVSPFYRDSGIALAAQSLTLSDCLLRNDVGGAAAGTYTTYGAQWCASCHDQRHSQAAGVINHPVNTSYTFGYGEVTTTDNTDPYPYRAPGVGGDATTWVGMGQTNAGYVMSPADAVPDGRVTNRQAPICQQCHEDARNVEAAYDADYSDLTPAGYNPVYLTFPHQSTNANFLVETNDDLCLNCHPVSALP